VDHERFAERAAKRLELVADRLEGEERREYGAGPSVTFWHGRRSFG
jgi:hypothetical protein